MLYPPFVRDAYGRLYQRIGYLDRNGRLHYRYVPYAKSLLGYLFW